jgi:dCTP diphosphatase
MLEASELLEHFQWKSADEMQQHIKDNKTEVSEELADVLFCVLLMARDFDVDILQTLSKKMDKNEAKYPIAKSKGNHKKYTELE